MTSIVYKESNSVTCCVFLYVYLFWFCFIYFFLHETESYCVALDS